MNTEDSYKNKILWISCNWVTYQKKKVRNHGKL